MPVYVYFRRVYEFGSVNYAKINAFLVQVNFSIPLKDDKNRELELGEFFLRLNKLTFLLPVIVDIPTQTGTGLLKSLGAQYTGYEIEVFYYYYYFSSLQTEAYIFL